MSVLIKGMEMPKCEPLMIRITPDGEVHYVGAVGQSVKRTKAIEIPPHGRLIDADALTELVETEFRNWEEDYDASQFLGDIEDAPTIIEAEE